MADLRLQTERLELVAATGALSHAAAYDHAGLGTLLDARVPPDWPPEIMRDVMEFFASHAASHEHELGWGAWYIVGNEALGRTVIGTCGFKGPPKEDGSVEVGYSVLPAFQRRGLGSEATRRLISWAFEGAIGAGYGTGEEWRRVERIYAETFPDPMYEASRRVMIKCGMSYAGSNGATGTILYVIERDVYEMGG
jgi:[ribosomal protein S5]-alanine N-acetyltransferase